MSEVAYVEGVHPYVEAIARDERGLVATVIFPTKESIPDWLTFATVWKRDHVVLSPAPKRAA